MFFIKKSNEDGPCSKGSSFTHYELASVQVHLAMTSFLRGYARAWAREHVISLLTTRQARALFPRTTVIASPQGRSDPLMQTSSMFLPDNSDYLMIRLKKIPTSVGNSSNHPIIQSSSGLVGERYIFFLHFFSRPFRFAQEFERGID